MGRPLLDGIYEHLVTEELTDDLAGLDPARRSVLQPLAGADAPKILARHLGREVERVLGALPHEDRAPIAAALVGELLSHLAGLGAQRGVPTESTLAQRITPPPQRLLAIHRANLPTRPTAPLSSSFLLTRRGRNEPSLGHEMAREIDAAAGIDAIVAFVTVGGIRVIRDALQDFARRGAPMRLLTTAFTGTTEAAALDELARLPSVSVKVSYDIEHTRLHAKAWLFKRERGLSTAYIGSANLTKTALGTGHEWMIRLSEAELPDVICQFEGTFDTLWHDPEFEPYHADNEAHRARLRDALRTAGSPRPGDAPLSTLISLRPHPFQQEILDRLQAERTLHGRRRNLVVAATGTGKTVIAALDYARVAEADGVRPRLLYLAHRREILQRARDVFRHALNDGAFGELWTGGDEPRRFDHVFATIQSAHAKVVRLGYEHFHHVIVDECHHVPAASYQALVPRLTPRLLVGLTATPERCDGQSLLPDFDGHIAAELRLWHALERQLLVPFEYYGISDNVDLRKVRWSRKGYDETALEGVYTGNDARASLILKHLERRVASLRQVRALGFCVGVEHAVYMAARFTAAGVPALALHGKSSDAEREDAPRRLQAGEVNVLFTCDLYNEGVDLPFVDTLLLLRPTMSAVLFMQQLGRGLRLHPGKTSCLVLDFIGQHHEEFRFDNILSALTAVPRGRLQREAEQGFPFLPSGCALQLDPVAREIVLQSLRSAMANAQRLARELRRMDGPGEVTLRRFLEETGREIEDVYDGKRGWAMVRRLAGVLDGRDGNGAEMEDLSRRLGWLLHLDEPARLRAHMDILRGALAGQPLNLRAQDRIRMHMLGYQLHDTAPLRAAEETAAYLAARPAIVEELGQVQEILAERIGLTEDVYPVPEWPLALHRHYKRREIMAAVGYARPGAKFAASREGVLRLDAQRREVLLVTLDKSGASFSPTTRYRDYAISDTLFHWETQATTSVTSKTGRRYIEGPGSGWTFYLLVRTDPDAAYAFLGPVTYERHAGNRPIQITWRLAHPLPAALLEVYQTLASG